MISVKKAHFVSTQNRNVFVFISTHSFLVTFVSFFLPRKYDGFCVLIGHLLNEWDEWVLVCRGSRLIVCNQSSKPVTQLVAGAFIIFSVCAVLCIQKPFEQRNTKNAISVSCWKIIVFCNIIEMVVLRTILMIFNCFFPWLNHTSALTLYHLMWFNRHCGTHTRNKKIVLQHRDSDKSPIQINEWLWRVFFAGHLSIKIFIMLYAYVRIILYAWFYAKLSSFLRKAQNYQ